MIGNTEFMELVVKAQGGDEASMSRLAAVAEESLRRYVFRITLDETLTQDIVQETMLEMFKVLDKLKRADRFSAWLHGIAFNRLRRHYGDRWQGKMVSADGTSTYADVAGGGQEGLASLVNAELKQIIFVSMGRLEPRHRAVLAMRCYDDMSYRAIAETMGMSEFGARALFFRAKKALARQLSRRGLGRGSLLTALVLFGKMTAVSEAAAAKVSVTAATVKVGIAAGAVGSAGGQAAAIAMAAATVITGAAVITTVQGDKPATTAANEMTVTLPAVAASVWGEHDARECWYYFPEGVGGPVMMRSVAMDEGGRPQWCQWLQQCGQLFLRLAQQHDHSEQSPFMGKRLFSAAAADGFAGVERFHFGGSGGFGGDGVYRQSRQRSAGYRHVGARCVGGVVDDAALQRAGGGLLQVRLAEADGDG